MARRPINVTHKPADPTRIPDILTEAATILVDLYRRGIVDAVGERLHIRRQGGYCGLDVWVLLVIFLTAGASLGLRTFWEKTLLPHARQLAALAGRVRLPSPASVSLDVDPTVTTLRVRALPTGEALPEPRRRSEDTGAPGYSGRKRGELQFRRMAVQHAGSSVWVHSHLSQGNGDGIADLELAVDTVVEACEHLGHPRSSTIVRMDGELGNVPGMTACRERGLPFLCRLNRPALYNDPEVLERLRQADWYRVSDSGGGP